MGASTDRPRRLLLLAPGVDGDATAAVRARALLNGLPDHGWRITAVLSTTAGPAHDVERPPSSRVVSGVDAVTLHERERFAALMSVGPLAVHVAARVIRRRTGLPWIAAFEEARVTRVTQGLHAMVYENASGLLIADGALADALGVARKPYVDRTNVAAAEDVQAVALTLDHLMGGLGGAPTGARREPNAATSASTSRTSAG